MFEFLCSTSTLITTQTQPVVVELDKVSIEISVEGPPKGDDGWDDLLAGRTVRARTASNATILYQDLQPCPVALSRALRGTTLTMTMMAGQT